MLRTRDTGVVTALLVALAAVVALTRSELGDYELRPSDDNAAPSIDRLLAGDVSGAIDVMPAMGLLSILWRLPLAAFGGSDLLWTHRLGALACLLAVVALAAVVDRRLAAEARPLAYRVVTALLLVAGPAIIASIDAGHPEEILGGALCVGAVLAALDDRRTLAAVLLGLAIGTKQWAVLAIVPVLLPLGDQRLLDPRRLRAGALAAGVAALLVVPPILADVSRYREISENLSQTTRVYAQSIWWPVSTSQTRTVDLGGGEANVLTTYALPGPLTRGPVTALAVLVALLAGGLGLYRGGLRDPLALLAALLALRCVLDPMNLEYYVAPALLAALTWEATRGPAGWRAPWVSIALAIATTVAWSTALDDHRALQWLIWLAATAPLLALGRLPSREAEPTEAISD